MGLESMNFPAVAAAAGSSLVEGPAGVGKDYDAAGAESFCEPLPPETVGELTGWTTCFTGAGTQRRRICAEKENVSRSGCATSSTPLSPSARASSV